MSYKVVDDVKMIDESKLNETSERESNTGLEITAGQRTMSGLIWELTGQPFVLPVMLTGHI